MTPKLKGTLSRGKVLEVSRILKLQHDKLPKNGYCIRFVSPVVDSYGRLRPEVCRDRSGYFFVGDKGQTAFRSLHGTRKRR